VKNLSIGVVDKEKCRKKLSTEPKMGDFVLNNGDLFFIDEVVKFFYLSRKIYLIGKTVAGGFRMT
jgi:hypothetical protein